MSRALFAAIRAGKIAGVMDALAEGADPNARDRTGLSALAAALTKDSIALIAALIAAGADVNAVGGDGLRPLDFAMLYCGHRAAKLLIDRGAEVDYIRTDGDPGLMAAAGTGEAKLVELFLAAGANPNTSRAIDGLSVADIQVIANRSQDAPAGMKRSSRRILDSLAAAGATVRTIEEIESLKDARRRQGTAVGIADRDDFPPDPALNEIKRFQAVAESAAFRATLDELAVLCHSPPTKYQPTDYPMHEDVDPVFACRFDKSKLLAHLGKANGKFAELLADIEDKVLARGFYLVQNTDIEGDNVRLLLPTADPIAVVYGHEVNTNGGVGLDELAAGLRKVYALAPFVVTDCGHDTIAGSYLQPVAPRTSAAIQEILNGICPAADDFDYDELDPDECPTAEELKCAAVEDRLDGFFLWWD